MITGEGKQSKRLQRVSELRYTFTVLGAFLLYFRNRAYYFRSFQRRTTNGRAEPFEARCCLCYPLLLYSYKASGARPG